jgi:hypothetical protein
MMIGKRIGISLIALALAGVATLPAPAAEVPVSPTPAAEAPASPGPKTTRTAAPVAKLVKPRVVKRFWRHRPIRLVAAEWHVHAGYRASVSYLVLGVAY